MIIRLANAFDRGLAALLAVLLLAIVAAVSWQVIARYLLDDPSGWSEELARFLLIWIGLLGGALAYHRNLHLGLDLLTGSARKRSKKAVTGTVLLFALAVLVGGGVSLVWLTAGLGQYSPALGLPMAVVYLALPASGIVISVSALAKLIEAPRGRES